MWELRCVLWFLKVRSRKFYALHNFFFLSGLYLHVWENSQLYNRCLTDVLFLICFFSLTLSDARTVSIIMRGTWSGATPLFIMVLLRLAWGQEVPLIPGKTWHVSQHVLVSSSVIKTSWSASIVMVCLCLSVCQSTAVWLIVCLTPLL